MAKQSFEKALEQLEHIVEKLESNELSLEKALENFEQGMKLSQYCAKLLDETERKISLIMEESDGSVKKETFDDSQS